MAVCFSKLVINFEMYLSYVSFSNSCIMLYYIFIFMNVSSVRNVNVHWISFLEKNVTMTIKLDKNLYIFRNITNIRVFVHAYTPEMPIA